MQTRVGSCNRLLQEDMNKQADLALLRKLAYVI